MGELRLIFGLAILWLGGGAVMGASLQALLGVESIVPCSASSLLVGMMLLLIVMRDEEAKRRLFGESNEEMPFNPTLAALLTIPLILIVIGMIWLSIALLAPN